MASRPPQAAPPSGYRRSDSRPRFLEPLAGRGDLFGMRVPSLLAPMVLQGLGSSPTSLHDPAALALLC